MIVAVAVYLLIQVCMVRETYDRLLQEGEYTAKAKNDRQENRKMGCHLLATGDGSVSWI